MKIIGFYCKRKSEKKSEILKRDLKLMLTILFLLLVIGNISNNIVAFKSNSMYELIMGIPNAIQ